MLPLLRKERSGNKGDKLKVLHWVLSKGMWKENRLSIIIDIDIPNLEYKNKYLEYHRFTGLNIHLLVEITQTFTTKWLY